MITVNENNVAAIVNMNANKYETMKAVAAFYSKLNEKEKEALIRKFGKSVTWNYNFKFAVTGYNFIEKMNIEKKIVERKGYNPLIFNDVILIGKMVCLIENNESASRSNSMKHSISKKKGWINKVVLFNKSLIFLAFENAIINGLKYSDISSGAVKIGNIIHESLKKLQSYSDLLNKLEDLKTRVSNLLESFTVEELSKKMERNIPALLESVDALQKDTMEMAMEKIQEVEKTEKFLKAKELFGNLTAEQRKAVIAEMN